jgi:hypothetical protein
MDAGVRLVGRVVDRGASGRVKNADWMGVVMAQQDDQGGVRKNNPPSSPITWIGFFAILAMLTWAFLNG